MDIADDYINRLKNVPPAPTVATELLEMFNDPNQDLDRIVELIRHDPTLTARILKRCNSAQFSGDQPATDMFEVVMRLGFYEVYCVVAALVAASTFASIKAPVGIDLNLLWRHSVMSAVAANKIAARVHEPEAVAFTSGLLHDFGKLIFASVEPIKYAELIAQHGAFNVCLSQAENATFGLTHASLGARLLTRWGLPDNIAGAVRHHDDRGTTATSFDQLAGIVQFANDLAHHLSPDEPHLPEMPPLNTAAMAFLRITSAEIPELIRQTQSGLQRVHGFSMLIFDPNI